MKQPLTKRQSQRKNAKNALKTLLWLAGVVSVAYSASCLWVVASGFVEPIMPDWFLGYFPYVAYFLLFVVCIVFCCTLDFLGIQRVFSFAVSEFSRWLLAPSQVNIAQRAIAFFGLLVGGSFVAASGLTSYYASNMASGVVATKMETPQEVKQAAADNKDYEAKLAPYRARLDSLESAKVAAISRAQKPYAGTSTWRIAKQDSIARAEDKRWAAPIAAAQKSLQKAEELHGKLLDKTSSLLLEGAENKLTAMVATNSALWAILFIFGLGAIIVEVVITCIIAFMDVETSCKIERSFARALARSDEDEDEEDLSSYITEPPAQQKPSGLGKRQGAQRPPSPSGSGRKNGSIPLDIDGGMGLFN